MTHRAPAAIPLLVALVAMLTAACAPLTQRAFSFDAPPQPAFTDEGFRSFDGAVLGLNRWLPEGEPKVVIIGLHGMNAYASAFNDAGKWWSERGVAVYAYDARGHGRSPQPGVWPEPEVSREDLRTAVKLARQLHPHAKIAVVGESMGSALAMTAFASDRPPQADALVVTSPALRGWGAIPPWYSVSLWVSTHVRPGWVVVPPKGVQVVATDNEAKLREMYFDPLVQKANRIDAVFGVVSLMEEADAAAAKLTRRTRTLMLYGQRDEVILEDGVRRTSAKLGAHVRTGYYPDHFHMMLNDLTAPVVWNDILGFILAPDRPLLSGARPFPWRKR